eukprot:TRINITY_DN135_c3_g1_i1.p1 TRINITY_DN135_c3_g1~~TRINITY_DN135_c3_g1_i1.p1  ORF type:complete len:230 (+),score=27.98 TRINITY_DN135_c3_g1_i1:41-730(+)
MIDTLKQRVIFVRHGERLDEADRLAWRALRDGGGAEHHDPPLTDTGRKQASAAGKWVGSYLGLENVDDLMLFSSPASRTLTTAVEFGRSLGLGGLTVVHGLYACTAAATMYGLPSLKLPHPSVALSPDSFALDGNEGNRFQSYMEAVAIAVDKAAAAGKVPVIVTHREGIRALAKEIGAGRVPVPYCCAHEFVYCRAKKSWQYVVLINQDVPARAPQKEAAGAAPLNAS